MENYGTFNLFISMIKLDFFNYGYIIIITIELLGLSNSVEISASVIMHHQFRIFAWKYAYHVNPS